MMDEELFEGFGADKRCGACVNIRRRKFDGGTVIHYCAVRPCNNNDAGLEKVKCKDFGCEKWEVRL
jgi:hypothetical protein